MKSFPNILTKAFVIASLVGSWAGQSKTYAAQAEISYINPGKTISSDGKYVLVATKEKIQSSDGKLEDAYFYRYATLKKGSAAELKIVSPRVFEALSGAEPDFRGYGPSLTQTSVRNVDNNIPLKGEWLATQYDGKKSSAVSVLVFNKEKEVYETAKEVMGVIAFHRAQIEAELDSKLKALLGDDYRTRYTVDLSSGGESLKEVNYASGSPGAPKFVDAHSNEFQIEGQGSGLIVSIQNSSLVLSAGEDSGIDYEIGYEVVLRISRLEGNGQIQAEVLSSQLFEPEAIKDNR